MSISKIDENLCRGCGICVDTCPEDVIRLNTDPLDVELRSPCAMGCPAGVSVRRYSYFIEMDMMEEAIEAFREYNPFPAVTGRICNHKCESKCARNDLDGAVNINALERYMGDYFTGEKADPVRIRFNEETAVIGSGPAGLSCAYYLCRKGYKVTVFEKAEKAGGMLSQALPDFRLPRDVVEDQIRYLKEMGVEFKCGCEIGKDIGLSELKEMGFKGIFIAAGLQYGGKLNIPGDDAEGVMSGIDFSKKVYSGESAGSLGRVVVIGGGNIGADVARTAVRQGADSVRLFCLESYDEMPMGPDDRKECEEDGIEIHAGWGQTEIISKDGRCSSISFRKCLSVINGGRFAPQFDDAISESAECDTVLFCIGQRPDVQGMLENSGIELTERGFIKADPLTLQTSVEGIFAGGDIYSGQKFVVDAIAAGREAAESIDRMYSGKDLKEGRDSDLRVRNAPKEGVVLFTRQEPEKGKIFTENEARLEAQRCMTCGSRAEIKYAEDCMLCLYCERDCPNQAIYVSPDRPARRTAPWDLA